jgi:hypothetical protein
MEVHNRINFRLYYLIKYDIYIFNFMFIIEVSIFKILMIIEVMIVVLICIFFMMTSHGMANM